MREKSRMTGEEFINMIVTERIKMVLLRKSDLENAAVADSAELVIKELDEEKRKKLEDYLNLMLYQRAEDEMKLYRAGFEDGIRLMRKIRF